MLSINRMTDYATLMLSRMAEEPHRSMSAAELAAEIPLAHTTIRKLLRILASQGVLISHKGRNGGFRLARPPAEISLAQVMEALDGPMNLTSCSRAMADCPLAQVCRPRNHLQRLGGKILALLEQTTLAELALSTKELSP